MMERVSTKFSAIYHLNARVVSLCGVQQPKKKLTSPFSACSIGRNLNSQNYQSSRICISLSALRSVPTVTLWSIEQVVASLWRAQSASTNFAGIALTSSILNTTTTSQTAHSASSFFTYYRRSAGFTLWPNSTRLMTLLGRPWRSLCGRYIKLAFFWFTLLSGQLVLTIPKSKTKKRNCYDSTRSERCIYLTESVGHVPD